MDDFKGIIMGKQAAASLKNNTTSRNERQKATLKRKKPANIPRELYNLISNNPTIEQSEEIHRP